MIKPRHDRIMLGLARDAVNGLQDALRRLVDRTYPDPEPVFEQLAEHLMARRADCQDVPYLDGKHLAEFEFGGHGHDGHVETVNGRRALEWRNARPERLEMGHAKECNTAP